MPNIPWGLIVLLFGILYGYFTPGRQDKWRMLKKGIFIGIVLALVLGILGYLANVNALGLGRGIVDVFVSVLVLTILFIVGVWLGDVLEGAPRRS